MKTKDNVNVLGENYRIIYGTPETHTLLRDCDGYTDTSVKGIVVDLFDNEQGFVKKDLEAYRNDVLRHEIIHAFLYESGLAINSNSCQEWAVNEEMVDWLAIQFPKIAKAFEWVGCL